MTLERLFQIAILALIQGAAELLPVSSSAHVVVGKRLLGYQANDFEWAFLLVMLHTGTMFSVLIHFWSRWKPLLRYWPQLLAATILSAGLGYGLAKGIEKIFLGGAPIETLFRYLPGIAAALAAAGVVILLAGIKEDRSPGTNETLSWPHAIITGLVQAICIPFRGFSRSGATISAQMFLGIHRMRAEEFSFALAVLLTPLVLGYSGKKMVEKHAEMVQQWAASQPDAVHSLGSDVAHLFLPGVIGMAFSFVAGLLALKLLSAWMERGHWKWFGYYCLVAAAVVLTLHYQLPPEAEAKPPAPAAPSQSAPGSATSPDSGS